MRAWIFALSCFGVTACTTLQPDSGEAAADTVLRTLKIITVDKEFSIGQAIAITGNRIVAVGSDAQIAPYVGSNTRVVDLGGRTVIPGLIDGHLHSAGGGPGLDLANARSIAELLAAVE